MRSTAGTSSQTVRLRHRRVSACATRRDVLGSAAVAGATAAVQNGQARAASEAPIVGKRLLAPGTQISEVIKGNWQLSGGHKGDRADDRTAGASAVQDFDAFVQAGITTFDTADIYGPSEGLIGDYLRRRPRGAEGLQILTKCCKFGSDMTTISQQSVSQGIGRSLERLGLPAVDLVQFYWHDYGVRRYVAAAQYLMEERARGRVRHVGVTNFDVPRMQQMLDGGVEIEGNQIQYSLLDRRPENSMLEFCQQNGIKLLPFGTVAGGLLSDKYLGASADKLKLNTFSKSKYASVISQCGGWAWFQALLAELDTVAQKHDTSISNVACRWVLDKPMVAGIIVGARNAKHVDDHRRLMAVRLDDEDRGRIAEVLRRGRQPKGDVYDWERGGTW